LAEAARLRQEEARRREEELAEAAKQRERELTEAARIKEEEARKREQELAEAVRLKEEEFMRQQWKMAAGKDPEFVEGEDGDREGFSLEVYRYIKRNKDLNVIVSIANASLYSIRVRNHVASVSGHLLVDETATSERTAR